MGEKKLSASRVKVLTLTLLIILVTGCTVLTDFISAEFSTSIFSDAYYWVQTITMQSAVIILLFVARTISKEKEKDINERFQLLNKSLQDAFLSINKENLSGTFKEYIIADNHARKLKAYREKLNAKISHYSDKIRRLELKKGRTEARAKARNKKPHGLFYAVICAAITRNEDKKTFWEGKLDRAEEEVDFVRRVKSVKYSYSILFADAKEKMEEEEDPSTHEGRDVAFILLTKGLSILAFGLIATSYISPHFLFDVALLYKTIIKVLQIVLGLYTGTVSGQDFIRHKMCAKLMTRFNYVKQFMEKRKTAPKNEAVPTSVS